MRGVHVLTGFVIRLCLFVCVLWVMPVSDVWAQDVIALTSKQGLQNSQIRDIYQDSRRNVWICTQDGLFRYDGVRLRGYYHDKHNPRSLGENYVCCALEYDRNRVLLGTKRGLYEYDYRTDSFRLLPFVGGEGDSLYLHVSSIYKKHDGQYVALVGGFGSYELKAEEDGSISTSMVTTYITSDVTAVQLLEDGEDNMFLLNDIHQVFRRKKGAKVFTLLEGVRDVVSICLGDDQNVYMGTSRNGLHVYDSHNGTVRKVSPEGEEYVTSCVVNIENGYIGICTDGHGLKLYDVRTGVLSQSNVRTPAFDFTLSNVKDAMFDHKGNLWVGIFWKGVFVQPFNSSSFRYIGRNSSFRNSIGTNCVTCVAGKAPGELWVASDNSGLYRVSDDGRQSWHLSGLPSTVSAICQDGKGNMYIGSSVGDFTCVDIATERVTNISKSVAGGERLSYAYSVDEDRDGNIWVATMGGGVSVYNPRSNTVESFTAKSDPNAQNKHRVLDNTYVKALKVCGNKLVVGTADGMEVYTIGNANALQRVARIGVGWQINAIRYDGNGSVWVATTGGLMKYSFSSPSEYQMFTVDDGLPNDFICSLETQDDGRTLWVSTHHGLCCFDMLKGVAIRNYYAADGLQDEEFSDNASVFFDGVMYFGGINGLTYFIPEDVTSSGQTDGDVELQIVDFSVFGKSVVAGQKSGYYTIMEGCVSDVSRIDLCSTDNTFSFDVSVMNISGQGVHFEYSVNEGEWTEISSDLHTVSFTNMQPGTYNVKVRAMHGGDVLAEKSLTICVHSAWYLSVWAKFVYFLLGMFVLYLIYLQLRERARARKILEHHRQNEQLNEARIQFFMNISHEIRTPMTLILSPLEKLMGLDKDEEHQRNYKLINQNAQRILRLINQLMEVRKIEKGEFSLEYTKVEAVSFLQGIFDVFETSASSRNIEYTYSHSMDKLDVYVDSQSLDKIVMNLLSNAFKFTSDGGKITLSLNVDISERVFTIEVTDNGVGIPDSEKDLVFRRFYSSPHQNGYIGTGIGLNLTNLLVGLHNGSIDILDNPEGHGTCMLVCMPIGDEMKSSGQTVQAEVMNLSDRMVVDENVSFGGKKAKRKYNMIVVDDEVDIRQYIHTEFASDYNIQEFGNGSEAWEFIHVNPDAADIIVSDIMMPVMDGNELCKRLKGNYNTSHIPMVLLTAKATDADRIAGAVLGADAYVTKPFNLELLRATVSNLIASRAALKGRYSANVVKETTIENIEVESPDQQFLEKVNKFISKHLDDPELSVEMIADNIGFSRVHFYRRVKELTGQTPLNYIKTIRLQQAARLLIEKNMDVTGVSVATGFKTLSTFSTSFKEFYGMTPSEYVKSHK